MSEASDSDAQVAMGIRLRQIREALGVSQEEMADRMGVVATTLSAWENGRNQIDLIKLSKAAVRWRFTIDWVALGDMSGIRKDLADRLDELLREGPRKRRGRPRSSYPRAAACPLAHPERKFSRQALDLPVEDEATP